jgi:hypothetical protein
MHTPILLLIWRRTHTLRKVLQAMRPLAPRFLFIACDGPSPQRPAEAENVAAARALIEEEIDWPCQIERLYSPTNQGCRIGVSQGINWFFNQVEEGIILEDDCVPHPDFFGFCTALLERYRDDDRIWCISGTNFQRGQSRGDGSYYFSRYAHCWGWASWRRCWKHYDGELSQLDALLTSAHLEAIFENPLEQKYWTQVWRKLHDKGTPNTWDYQWIFTCLINGGLTATPNHNLVSNVGFDQEGTHTTNRKNNVAAMKIDRGLDNFDPPSFLLRDAMADAYTFDNVFGGRNLRFPRSIIRLPRRLSSYIMHRATH